MDRKQFLKSTLLLGGLGLAGSALLIESCKKSSNTAAVNFTLDLSQSVNSALNSVGGSVASNNVVVICTATNTWVALSQLCTHQGCSLSYSKSAKQLICPCHGGTFDTSGNVVSGPPPSALTKYTVTKSGTVLTITG